MHMARVRKARKTTRKVISHRTPPKPIHWNCKRGTCRFCGDPIIENDKPNTRKHWHQACAELWVIMNNPSKAREHVLKRDNYTCQSCLTYSRYGQFDVDHRKPLYEANGDHSYWQPPNLVLLCKDCHKAKTKTDMVLWRAFKALD